MRSVPHSSPLLGLGGVVGISSVQLACPENVPLLVAVESAVGVIVLPIEPEVFEHIYFVEASTFERSGYGAAFKVPFAEGVGVEEHPGLAASVKFERVAG